MPPKHPRLAGRSGLGTYLLGTYKFPTSMIILELGIKVRLELESLHCHCKLHGPSCLWTMDMVVY